MHTMRKLFSPWKALVAAIAVFASAGSAQAGLSLYFVSSTGPVDIGTVVDGSTGSFTAGDFTGTYKIHSTLTAADPLAPGAPSGSGFLAVRTLSVEITATNNSTTTARTLSAFLTGTDLTGPGNGAGVLVAGIQVATPPGNPPGASASFSSTAFYNSTPVTTGSVTSTTYNSTAITINNPYDLVNYSVESTIAAKGSFKVTGSSQVYGVPEPSGIAAALAGVPCLGLLLGTIRRRLTGNAAPVV